MWSLSIFLRHMNTIAPFALMFPQQRKINNYLFFLCSEVDQMLNNVPYPFEYLVVSMIKIVDHAIF